MEIVLLDSNLNIVGQPIELFSSLQWNRAYYEVGTFELHASADLFQTLRSAYYLYRRDTEEAGIIERVEYTQSEKGDTECSASGRFVEAILERNVIDKTFSASGAVVSLMRNLVSNFAINPDGSARKILRLRLGSVSVEGVEIHLQTTWTNLLEKLQEIGRTQELALRIRLDFEESLLLFEVWQGKDRTQGQAINSWATFSNDFENLRSLTYIYDKQRQKNFAYVAGAGEGIQRTIITVDHTDGGERHELFVDARDLQPGQLDGSELTKEDYAKTLIQRGEERLAEYAVVETMTGEIETNANLIYRQDFDLGDKCTCVGPGIMKEARITQITEVYEPSGIKVRASFGDGYITDLTKFIKREVG